MAGKLQWNLTFYKSPKSKKMTNEYDRLQAELDRLAKREDARNTLSKAFPWIRWYLEEGESDNMARNNPQKLLKILNNLQAALASVDQSEKADRS